MSIDITDPEALLIGACLHPNDGYRYAAKVARAEDFRNWNYGKLFRAIGDLDKDGVAAEPGTLAQVYAEYEIQQSSLPVTDLWNLLTAVGNGEQAEFYGLKVHDAARRRRAYAALTQALTHLEHEGITVDETLHRLDGSMKELSSDTVHDRINPELLYNLLADFNPDEAYDWLVPGLLERGDRMIVTAADGYGKSTWLRLLSLQMAGGIHPVHKRKVHFEPIRVMYIDPENTRKQWLRESNPMVRAMLPYAQVNPSLNLHLANTPRLSLVKGHDLARIHRLIDQHKTDLVVIGPLYKITAGSLNNEDDAAMLINSLDSIHDRGVALMMEAHPAKGSNGYKNWTPRGSAALSGWPEFGLALTPDPDDDDACIVERWRGQRDASREWPQKLVRGGSLPWLPVAQ